MPEPSFTDRHGRVWPLVIDFAVARRVKESPCGVDLLDVSSGRVFTRLASEPLLVFDVLWLLCEKTAERDHQVTQDDFAEAIDGRALEGAIAALEAAIVGFSPPSTRRRTEAVIGKLRKAEAMATEAAAEVLDDPEFEAAIAQTLEQTKRTALDQAKRQLAATTGGPATSSPPSSGSTRAATPSGA